MRPRLTAIVSGDHSNCGRDSAGVTLTSARRRGDVHVRGDEVHDRQVLGEDRLHLVEQPLALGFVGGADLPPHQLVDLAFPVGRRRLLADVPDVRRPRAEPEVGVHRRIGVGREDAEIDRVVVASRHEPLDDRGAVERHDVDDEADLLQLVADHRRAALERRASSLRQQREAGGTAAARLRAGRRRCGRSGRSRPAARARGPDRAAAAAGGRKPALVRRRDRTEHRHAGARDRPCRQRAGGRRRAKWPAAARRAAATRRAGRHAAAHYGCRPASG